MLVLHLTTDPELAAARAAGEYGVSSRGLSLADVGFIHACTSRQLPGVAQRFYADVTDPLVALVVDLGVCEAAGVPVRWEPAPDAPQTLFPHIYGPLPWHAIVAQLPAAFDDGHVRIDGVEAYDVADTAPGDATTPA